MNAQKIFDTVARHLLTQREKSQDADGCKYRLKRRGEILKCAAGVLIPDAAYERTLEHKGVRHEAVWNATGLPGEFQPIVNDFQNLHDNHLAESWPYVLLVFAEKYSLDPAIVAELAPEGQWHPATS